MDISDYEQIKSMTDKLIAFINWKGAPFESKKKKVIKEITMIRDCCKNLTVEKSKEC